MQNFYFQVVLYRSETVGSGIKVNIKISILYDDDRNFEIYKQQTVTLSSVHSFRVTYMYIYFFAFQLLFLGFRGLDVCYYNIGFIDYA